MTSTAETLCLAVRSALARHGYFATEDGRRHMEQKIDLQTALTHELGNGHCLRSRAATFNSPIIPAPPPPAEFGNARDVCSVSRRPRCVDILWQSPIGPVVIEAKLRRITKWTGSYVDGSVLAPRKYVDAYSYTVLKDIHRLERLASVRGDVGYLEPAQRFVLFLTNDPYEFEARVPHAQLKLTNGRVLQHGHLVQYNLLKASGDSTSLNTLWRDYAPFHLAGFYLIKWKDLQDDVSKFTAAGTERRAFPSSRLLLIEVQRQ